MKYIISLLVVVTCLGCASVPHYDGHDEYVKKIEDNSAGDKQFAGLYHNFEFRTTLLSRDVSKAIHERLTLYYAWDEPTASEKWSKIDRDLNEKTTLWLSFFTPESRDDNLANKVSIWKLYLEVDGQRYEGRARRANNNLSEAVALYPYHNRWATAYYVDFPMPTSIIEGRSVKFIITGPLGQRQVKF